MSDLISRQTAIDAIDDIESEVADGDGFQYAKWREYFCDLPSAQPDLQSTCNQLATDTISRQAAIDAILAVTGNSSVRELYEHVQEHGLSEMWSGGVSAAIDIIIAVPSAQPEERTETHACDCISRQDAIDHWRLIIDATSTDSRYNMGFVDGLEFCISHLSTMPSAQPEIIRCRDCKYWREHKYAKETKRYIPFCGFNAIYTKADDFCSRAERRIDE